MNADSKSSSASEPIRLSEEGDFTLGDLEVRPSLRESVRDGRRTVIEPRVMQVLVALVRAEGAVVSRDELIRRCWDGRVVGEAAINRCILKLRELADAGDGKTSFRIETIARVGYRLERVEADPLPTPIVSAPATRERSVLVYAIGAALALVTLIAATWLGMRGTPSVAPPSRPAEDASIAVLPFKNLSADPDAGYFAAGIHDEILTRLAKIGSLRVISRTSAEQVAARPGTLKDMARVLGVANVVEGSVQRVDDKVRVNVQLIRVDTDAHLWAEDYDRKLDDVLSVENEVAAAIAVALAGKITPGERAAITMQPAPDPRAYDFYLRGLESQRRFDVAGELDAVAAFEQAVAIDPSFAVAWAQLSHTHAFLAFSGDRHADHGAGARVALSKALALNPDLVEVQLADAAVKCYVDRDFVGAERAFKTVYARWPGNVEVLNALALVERRLGHWTESVALLRKGITLDPLVLTNYVDLTMNLQYERDNAGAITTLDTALAIWPNQTELLAQKIEALQSLGELDRADAVIGLLHVPDNDDRDVTYRRIQFAYRRQFAEGRRYLEQVYASPRPATWSPLRRGTLDVSIGDFRLRDGDANGARRSYQAALDLMLPLLKDRPDDDNILPPVALAYAGLQDKTSAMRYIDHCVAMHPIADVLDGFDDAYARVAVASRLGDRDVAIEGLQRLMSETGPLTTTMLELDPDLDPLRDDPRFGHLLAMETPRNKP